MSSVPLDSPARSEIFIDGAWMRSASPETIPVVNPATDQVIAMAPAGCVEDVERAVSAARAAFPAWSATPLGERLDLLARIRDGFVARQDEFARVVTAEMGSPLWFSRVAQVSLPVRNIESAINAMSSVRDERVSRSTVVREPVGVVAAITPWNFPLHQITAKVAPALAAGCTVVLKPSEFTPLDAWVLTEVMASAGVPHGVFNLVVGGALTGEALVAHPNVNMISFTGSSRAGVTIAERAARGLKKVALELGGKSANIVLDDADLAKAIPAAVRQCFVNSGQTCAALSRLLVPMHMKDSAQALAVEAAEGWLVGDPLDPATQLGPLASRRQQHRVQEQIRLAMQVGARLLTGGPEQPESQRVGAFVRPTVFTDVTNDMQIAREETFGPVLTIMGYRDVEDAIRLANDSEYGLSGGVWSADHERAIAVARRLHTGHVVINGAGLDVDAPFGGVKMSGIGREYGRYGLEEYFHLKTIVSSQAS